MSNQHPQRDNNEALDVHRDNKNWTTLDLQAWTGANETTPVHEEKIMDSVGPTWSRDYHTVPGLSGVHTETLSGVHGDDNVVSISVRSISNMLHTHTDTHTRPLPPRTETTHTLTQPPLSCLASPRTRRRCRSPAPSPGAAVHQVLSATGN